MKNKDKKILLGTAIFTFVFISFTLAIMGHGWYVDDLGVILNGLIIDLSSFCRVFSEDMRNYASTYNYNLPTPNVLSGFLRPMEQVFFSITHHLFGTNIFAFHLLQAFFHAANALLLFILFCNWLPLSFSAIGALLFAFYPSTTWLTWICTLQHSLTLFFLIIAILLYLPILKRKVSFHSQPLFYLSGLSFLFSLLSRETHIFLAPWAFLGIFLLSTNKTNSFISRILKALSKTWIFFLATTIYIGMRLYVFGFASLLRTARNILIRFPFLTKLFSVSATSQTAPVQPHGTSTIATHATKAAKQAIDPIMQESCNKLSVLQSKFFEWAQTILNIQEKIILIFVIVVLLALLIIAYRKHKTLALFFATGLPLFIWPCILVYPAPRYMNTTYPYLIFVILLGVYFIAKEKTKTFFTKSIVYVFFILSILSLIHGFRFNIIQRIKNPSPHKVQKCYIDFFKENKFPKKSHFIFISTLDEADLEQLLQVASNNFELRAAHIVISKIAGPQYGCKISGYSYTINPIPTGYRFTSQDKKNFGWSFHSYQPIVWSEEERAYVLAPDFFEENQWHEFSMGKFFIHESVNKKYVTDVSFVFDKKWIIPNTFIVAFDPINQKYKVLDSSHIK
ncbi:glycosyltransferase family 39 protein [Candidatus Dependentiae bacterium]|nr:glycosyltransferase family 39 protein [Candidatus Dependentiae bacterium]